MEAAARNSSGSNDITEQAAAAAAESKETAAAATMLATEKAAAATGTKDVIVDFATDMRLWLDAFRPVTGAETQVIHQVMLLLFVRQFSAAQFLLDMLIYLM